MNGSVFCVMWKADDRRDALSSIWGNEADAKAEADRMNKDGRYGTHEVEEWVLKTNRTYA